MSAARGHDTSTSHGLRVVADGGLGYPGHGRACLGSRRLMAARSTGQFDEAGEGGGLGERLLVVGRRTMCIRCQRGTVLGLKERLWL